MCIRDRFSVEHNSFSCSHKIRSGEVVSASSKQINLKLEQKEEALKKLDSQISELRIYMKKDNASRAELERILTDK